MPDALLELMTRYANFSSLGDGQPEIIRLTYAPFERADDQPPTDGRLALVLIEPRLLADIPGLGGGNDLLPRLERFKGDLRAEGLHSRFILAEVNSGSVPKDGRTLLAIRRFLKDVRNEFANFEGVTLVGAFPEAALIRRWIWANPHGCWVNGAYRKGTKLSIAPEPVSTRTEIVLADLDGNWESLYCGQAKLESIHAFPDAATAARGWYDGEISRDCVFSSSDFGISSFIYDDCFVVDDAIYTIEQKTETPPYLRLRIRTTCKHPEIGPSDRGTSNPIARPNIAVSRINARNIAQDPDPARRGDDGGGFLDSAGNPRTLASSRSLFSDPVALFNTFNPKLERRLLNDYFDRNHRFRIGAWSHLPFRVSALTGTNDFAASHYANMLANAATDFAPPRVVDCGSVVDYIAFLREPAVLKMVVAHSSDKSSTYDGDYETEQLEQAVGRPPFRWKWENHTYTPSLAEQGKGADLFVHRTLWHHRKLADASAALMIHGGCDVNSVPGTRTENYTDPGYARFQNAESVLLCTNTVSLLSRAKGFNDKPDGFAEGFWTSERANFGAAWKAYYNTQASDAALAANTVQAKRAYFWSITGDWTTRLRNKNGLGILGLEGPLKSLAVHPNRAWIEGWNFDATVDRIAGIGDIDGDGVSEFVVTSDWGIGVLGHDGKRWRQRVVAPRDSWFGSWRWDATTNSGRDIIHAVGNFTGSAAHELLVTSSWGIGVLGLSGTNLMATRAHASGTRLGGWVYDANNNEILGCGDLDGSGRQAVIVASPWGIGVLSLERNTSLAMHANGSRLGGWMIDTSKDTVPLVADFDGDGRAELLITSPWGIAVLELGNGGLTSIATHANGEDLGMGYTVDRRDTFAAADRLRNTSQHEIIVVRETGIWILALVDRRLRAVAAMPNGTRVGGWLIDGRSNRVRGTGPLLGQGRREFVLTSPWGVGVIGLSNSGAPSCPALHAFGTVLGDWYLQSTDVVVGVGNFSGGYNRSEILLLKRRS